MDDVSADAILDYVKEDQMSIKESVDKDGNVFAVVVGAKGLMAQILVATLNRLQRELNEEAGGVNVKTTQGAKGVWNSMKGIGHE